MRHSAKITIKYLNYRGVLESLELSQESPRSFRDKSGRVFGSLAMAKAVHRTGSRTKSIIRQSCGLSGYY